MVMIINKIIVAKIAPIFPKKQKMETMRAARKTPRAIAKNDKIGFKPKIKDAKAPVQAPVVGKGIPTKMISPKISYFSIILLFFCVLSNSQSKNFFKKGIFIKRFKINLKRKRIGKIGKRLPIIDNIRPLR